ncbi:MAG: cysteine desulfurase [Conexivisphaerales archaeon]
MQSAALDVEAIRNDFPIFKVKFNGKSLAYLDNAATSQKPIQVIDALREFYEKYNSNIHRGVYKISEKATEAYESSREATANFIGSHHPSQVIFTRNTTESINLVAYTWGRTRIRKGSKIVLTMLEHHSNLVPWQELAREKDAKIEYVDIKEDGTLDMSSFEEKIKDADFFAFTHVSNVLGTINDAKELIRRAHKEGAIVLLDGAQSVPHMPVNVIDLDCDFFAFSAHKMLGPTGVGVLYGKKDLLEEMPPFIMGGDMISEVHLQGARWNELPWKFEGGTSNIGDVIAFREAIRYLERIGMGCVREHEKKLTKYALEELSRVKQLRVFGPRDVSIRGGVIPFVIDGVHPHDAAAILDTEAIAVRSGNHCAQPLHENLDLDATTRASFYIYNTEEEVDRLVNGLEKVKRLMLR